MKAAARFVERYEVVLLKGSLVEHEDYSSVY